MDWLMIGQTFGVPVVLLAALLFGGAKAARWIAENMLKPITQRHLGFLDRIEAMIARQTDVFETMNAQQTKIIRQLLEQRKLLEQQHEQVVREITTRQPDDNGRR